MEGDGAAVVVGIVLVVWLVCAFAAASIASKKGLSAGGFFFAGLLLGVIGVLIAAVAQPAQPVQPAYGAQTAMPGWYTDPWDANGLRWHDGWNWTHHVSQPHAEQPTGGVVVDGPLDMTKPRPRPEGESGASVRS